MPNELNASLECRVMLAPESSREHFHLTQLMSVESFLYFHLK